MKTMMKLILAFSVFLCFNIHLVMSQSAYVVNSSGTIYDVNMASCSYTTLCSGTGLQSIAYYNGFIYGTEAVGSTDELYKLDLTTCNKTSINSALPSSNINALVCDGAGNFYAASSGGSNIYKYSLLSDTWTTVGSIPGYSSAGDLTFYNGELYGVSIGSPNKLYKITLSPFSATLVGNIGTGSDIIYGIITSASAGSCTGTVYAMIQSGGTASIGTVDISTAAVTPLCPNILGTMIYDATSPEEGGGGMSLLLSANPVSICNGDTTQLNAQTGFASYNWSGSGLISSSGVSVFATPTATTTYTVTAIDSSGFCTSTAQITVVVNADPVIQVTATDVCSGYSALLIASGANTYSWSNGLGANDSVSTPPLYSNTTYSVTGTSASGCSASASVNVNIVPPPVIHITATDVCPGYSALLIALGANTYSWSDGLGVNDSASTPLLYSTTTYSVTGTSASGCSASASVNVNVLQFNDDFSYLPLTPFINTSVVFSPLSTNGTVWSWDLGNGTSSSEKNPTTSYSEPGIYTVMLISTNVGGCSDTIIKQIEILPELEVFVPNVFTPNNDGVNDVFGPVVSGQESFDMMVFNRWGKIVFETNAIDKLWDGTADNGKLAAEGVYYYVMVIGQFTKEDLNLSGSVSLYR